MPRPFHWSQVESEDFREYIANLRALDCPERLIRDMITSELDDLYGARHGTIQWELLPPWAGADRRQAAYDAHRRQRRALEQEQRAVTEQLLGCPWFAEAIRMFNEAPGLAVLLGHLTADQSIQLLSLAEIYRDRARGIRDSAQGILLAEDRAELTALDDELKARLATILNPAQLEELTLRIHWIEDLANERHFELADLTGAEVRQIVRLHTTAFFDPIAEHLISPFFDPITEHLIGSQGLSDTEHAGRKRDFEADVLALLGPEKTADLNRAGDDRYREILQFAQQRQLPRQSAVAAYEIRAAAEEEIKWLTTNSQLEAPALQAEFKTIQTATLAALTQVLGPTHLHEYLGERGQWLEAMTSTPVEELEEHP